MMDNVKLIFTKFLPNATCSLGKKYVAVAIQGIDDRDYRPVNLTHFILCTPFHKKKVSLFQNEVSTLQSFNYKFDRIIDSINEDQYLDDDLLRCKCLSIAAGTPLIQAVGILISVINRIVKLVTLAHFWYPSEKEYLLKERAWTFSKDLLRVAFSPLIYVGMILSSLYGLAFSNNGRKLYATFERCIYGNALFAPCFQPSPTHHLGGTPIDQQGW